MFVEELYYLSREHSGICSKYVLCREGTLQVVLFVWGQTHAFWIFKMASFLIVLSFFLFWGHLLWRDISSQLFIIWTVRIIWTVWTFRQRISFDIYISTNLWLLGENPFLSDLFEKKCSMGVFFLK